MDPTNTPDVPCVSVSTAVKRDPITGLELSNTYGTSLSEQSALRFLIKEHGWYFREPGVLRRRWNTQEAA